MGLKFYMGGSGAGKSYGLYQDVIEMSLENPKTQYLIIVPDQFTMQTQKEVVGMHPHKGIMNIDVLSFGRLSHRVFEEVGGNDKPALEDTGKSLVLRRVAGALEHDMQAIGSHLKKIGYIHEVKSSLSEFMQYGIGLQELDEIIDLAEKKGALQYKLKDLRVLYEGFLGYIRERFITTEESLTILKNVLEKSRLIQNSVVVFDGFTGFTPVQNALIQRIMELAGEVIITVVLDGEEDPYHMDGEQKLFHLSKRTINTLEHLAEQAGVPRRKDVLLKGKPVKRFENQPGLAHLEQNLFRFGSGREFLEEQGAIAVYELLNPKEEVRFIGSRILQLVRENGWRYQDIAVVTGDLPGYAHFVKHEFAAFGIPCFIDQTKGIILNPFIEYIRSGLAVIGQNFSYEAIFHFLRSGLLPIERDRLDHVENYVLGLGIRGKRMWRTKWLRKTREMGANAQEELDSLNRVRETIMELFKPLFVKKKTAGELAAQVYEFIAGAKLQQKLADYERYFTGLGDFASAKEYSQIYRLVCELLEQIVELLGEEEMDLKEFVQILDAGFGEIQVGSIPQNVDQVVVGDIERTRLKEIKVLFFMGINDGNIPKSGGSGGLLSDIDREFLLDMEIELAPTPRQQMYIQRLYLYMNMTKPTEQLYLSYALVNGEGKSQRPAYLIGEVIKLFPALQVCAPVADKLADAIAVPGEGLDCLARGLREYTSGLTSPGGEEELAALFHWYDSSEAFHQEAANLLKAAFHRYEDNPISRAAASALYGPFQHNSVSRLEKYAACAYAHFLQYGLELRERDIYGFENVDMGNVFHGVLEKFALKLEEAHFTWMNFPPETGRRLVSLALEEYAAGYGETVLFDSARNEYLIAKMERILNRTVETLQYQLKKGIFEPSDYELPFTMEEELDGAQMQVRGRIDRVDLCSEGDKVYVKVMDYKSGSRTFDVTGLYYGLQLQLMTYLNAAVELTEKKYPGKSVIPAAVLYYHVADPWVDREGEQMSSEEINRRLREELRTTGLINADSQVTQKLDASLSSKSDVVPLEYKKDGSFTAASSVIPQEELRMLSQYARNKMKEFGNAVLEGRIPVNPYEMGSQSSCTYCNYHGVCGYDKRIPGYSKRNLDMDKETALEKIKEQMRGDQDKGEGAQTHGN